MHIWGVGMLVGMLVAPSYVWAQPPVVVQGPFEFAITQKPRVSIAESIPGSQVKCGSGEKKVSTEISHQFSMSIADEVQKAISGALGVDVNLAGIQVRQEIRAALLRKTTTQHDIKLMTGIKQELTITSAPCFHKSVSVNYEQDSFTVQTTKKSSWPWSDTPLTPFEWIEKVEYAMEERWTYDANCDASCRLPGQPMKGENDAEVKVKIRKGDKVYILPLYSEKRDNKYEIVNPFRLLPQSVQDALNISLERPLPTMGQQGTVNGFVHLWPSH